MMLLCDEPHCGQVLIAKLEPPPLDADPAEVVVAQVGQFVTAANQQGWQVGLDRHICPRHVKAESRIILARNHNLAMKN